MPQKSFPGLMATTAMKKKMKENVMIEKKKARQKGTAHLKDSTENQK